MKKLIYNGLIYPNDYESFNGSIVIDEGKIVDIIKDNNLNLEEYEVIDASNLVVMPGFIDIHTHGAFGYDFINSSKEGIDTISKNVVKAGTTAYLASMTVISHQDTLKLLQQYEKIKSSIGAEFLGIHLEGPYLSEKYHALMDVRYLRDPNMDEVKEMLNASSKIKVMTFAPELNKSNELIKIMNEHNVSMMIGHSAASFKEASNAINNGAMGFTHLYNAMSQHTHRNPGCVSAALANEKAYCELICDGFHVDPEVVKLTYKILTPNRLILITDSMPAQCLADGEYLFSNLICEKKGIQVRVKETGRIAGSGISMNNAFTNIRKYCHSSYNDIVKMMSINPSIIAKCDNVKGKIAINYDADIIILDNDDIKYTFTKGDITYKKEA